MKRTEIVSQQSDVGKRTDVFLSETTGMTRSHISKLIKQENILVNNNKVKPGTLVNAYDNYIINLPDPVQTKLEAQNIPLDIVYQDSDLLVVNKPRGMVVHPGHGNWKDTLVNSLLFHVDDLSGINGEIRPGIIHRLDKNTTGLLVIAKNDYAHNILSDAIKNRQVKRQYLALVQGNVKQDCGVVDAPIGRSPKDRKLMAVVSNGRQARTHWQVETRYDNCTLVRCTLETGRTHQIRVHMAYIGHPVIADPDYGSKKQRATAKGQLLHSACIGFVHPRTGKNLEFECDIPEDFKKKICTIR